MFLNREEAGVRLAEELRNYQDSPNTLVLGLPRGGIIVASQVAWRLNLPLDVFISLRVRSPIDADFALGAVTETGTRWFNMDILENLKLSPESMGQEVAAREREVELRRGLYRGGQPLPEVRDKTVLLVDEGMATGSTFLGAVAALRALKPASLVAAVPIGALSLLASIEAEVDSLVAVESPYSLVSVADHYLDFSPVIDTEAAQRLYTLREARLRAPKRLSPA